VRKPLRLYEGSTQGTRRINESVDARFVKHGGCPRFESAFRLA